MPDRHGYWHRGDIKVYSIGSEVLFRLLAEEAVTSLESAADHNGEFRMGLDCQFAGNYRGGMIGCYRHNLSISRLDNLRCRSARVCPF